MFLAKNKILADIFQVSLTVSASQSQAEISIFLAEEV